MKMKKLTILVSLFLFSMHFNFCQSFKEKIDKTLQPLRNNEFFEWTYDSKNMELQIFKINDHKKEIYETLENLLWGSWEVSNDRRKIIYYENLSNYDEMDYPNYYLLDGNTGKTRELGKIHTGYTSSDFKYLIYQDETVYPLTKIVIYNLVSNNIENEIYWSLNSEKYFLIEENTMYILRSLLTDYDFHIYIVGAENSIFAEGYLNISKGEIKTCYDDGDEERIFDISNFSRLEFGQ